MTKLTGKAADKDRADRQLAVDLANKYSINASPIGTFSVVVHYDDNSVFWSVNPSPFETYHSWNRFSPRQIKNGEAEIVFKSLATIIDISVALVTDLEAGLKEANRVKSRLEDKFLEACDRLTVEKHSGRVLMGSVGG